MQVEESDKRVLAQFLSEAGDATGPPLELPYDITTDQLMLALNELLDNVLALRLRVTAVLTFFFLFFFFFF